MGTPFPDQYDDRYFTLQGYRAILSRAQALDYDIVPFRDFSIPGERPLLLLRHDLDHTLSSVGAVAEIEAELGIRATYFVQTSCEFYNLLALSSRALLRRLTDLGHEIGLHYVAAHYQEPGRTVEKDVRLLEDLGGQSVLSASQHIPIDGEEFALPKPIQNEAYEPRFTNSPMTYISDSLMVWRQATPYDLLESRASFQFLMHPEVWRGNFSNMGEALLSLEKEELSRVSAGFTNLQSYYRKLLEERLERDLRFKARAAGRVKHADTQRL
jgi:hypothetical protein